MRSIDDNDRKIHSAMEVAFELGITPKTIVDIASKLKSFFLIKTPENTEIYLRCSERKRLARLRGELALIFDFGRAERTFLVTSNIDFLCLEPSDYESLIPMGHIQQKEFNSIATIEKDFEITILNSATYTDRYPITATAVNGTFDSFHKEKSIPLLPPNKPTQEKTITFTFNDLFITTKDLKAIREDLSNKRPAYGKFKTEEWTSTMLAQLNEASTYFFSGESNNIDKTQLCNEIKNWFARHWVDGGKDLIEQATNALLPDNLYKSAPPKNKVNDSLRNEYNSYASTALILINKKAKECWQEMKSSKNYTFPKNESIKRDLQSDSGLSAKLAVAAATIIRLDAKK